MNTHKPVPLIQAELVELALNIAKDFKVDLDFSEKSLKKVDKILDWVHKDSKKNSIKNEEKDEALYGIALEFGAYIVEVIQRNYGGGIWKRDDPELGEETWPLTYNDLTIFPVTWCLRQIYSGKEESIYYKYRKAFLDKI